MEILILTVLFALVFVLVLRPLFQTPPGEKNQKGKEH